MNTSEDTRQISQMVKTLAMQIATDRANTTKWNLKVAIVSYVFLVALIILVALDAGFTYIVVVAILGLITIWLVGWRQGIQLRQRYYAEELSNLREGPVDEFIKPEVNLTSREIETLSYMAQGYSNKQIALKLGLGEQTVKNYVSVIFNKMNVRQRTEAAVIAIKQGLIDVK